MSVAGTLPPRPAHVILKSGASPIPTRRDHVPIDTLTRLADFASGCAESRLRVRGRLPGVDFETPRHEALAMRDSLKAVREARRSALLAHAIRSRSGFSCPIVSIDDQKRVDETMPVDDLALTTQQGCVTPARMLLDCNASGVQRNVNLVASQATADNARRLRNSPHRFLLPRDIHAHGSDVRARMLHTGLLPGVELIRRTSSIIGTEHSDVLASNGASDAFDSSIGSAYGGSTQDMLSRRCTAETSDAMLQGRVHRNSSSSWWWNADPAARRAYHARSPPSVVVYSMVTAGEVVAPIFAHTGRASAEEFKGGAYTDAARSVCNARCHKHSPQADRQALGAILRPSRSRSHVDTAPCVVHRWHYDSLQNNTVHNALHIAPLDHSAPAHQQGRRRAGYRDDTPMSVRMLPW